MKTINTTKPENIIINRAFLGILIAFALAFTPIYSANAGTNGGWSDFSSGYGGVYDYGDSGYGGVYDYGDSGYGGVYDYGYDSYSAPYYEDYGSYGGYSAPSYSYGGYSAPTYSYTPQPSYQYIPTGGSSAPQAQYVYSSNENNNVNANENNNIITNTFNPTNNNDARINLIVYGGGGTNTNQDQSLDGNCVITPTTAYINQDVTFYVNATGGVGGYSYSWTGTDGIYSSAQSFTGRYSYPGYKTATVTIRSGSQTISRTCSVNVQAYNTVLNTQSNVTVLRDQNLGTPVSGVFLSQVPETGIGFGLKMTLFTLGLTLWSIFAAYMISRKRNGAFANKINAFKLANMQKKGIQA